MSATASAFHYFVYVLVHCIVDQTSVKIRYEPSKIKIALFLGAAFVGSLSFAFTILFGLMLLKPKCMRWQHSFMAVMFYLGLRWEKDMFTPRGNKWLILISFVVGLSFGVHFMGLLTIPAISLIYFFKNYKTVTVKNFILANVAGMLFYYLF